MPDPFTFHDPDISITTLPEGAGRPDAVRVDLQANGHASTSTCVIIPFRLRVGAAVVRMDGIGGVGTLEEFRYRGYARRVLTAAIRHMEAGDAALTMLYGIPDLYPKFGYATAGPEYLISLPALAGTPLPDGWTARPLAQADLPDIYRLYAENTAHTVEAVIRSPEHFPWTKLPRLLQGETKDECRVVVDPAGRVRAYAWHGAEFWAVRLWGATFRRCWCLGK